MSTGEKLNSVFTMGWSKNVKNLSTCNSFSTCNGLEKIGYHRGNPRAKETQVHIWVKIDKLTRI